MAQLTATLRTNPLLTPAYNSIRANGSLMEKVYSLRYESYSKENYIDPNEDRLFMDEYDDMKNCASYLTYYGKNAIGSIRLCSYEPNSSCTIPAFEDYSEDIDKYVGFDKRFVEVNRFVVHPSFQRLGGVQARFSIYKNIIGEAEAINADCVLAAVRPEHTKFYKMVNFEPISNLKCYPKLKFKTILMACFELEKARNLVLDRAEKVRKYHGFIPDSSSSRFVDRPICPN